MGSATLVPVEMYLRTTYHPDCDYIDGVVLERNMGEIPHGRLQAFFIMLFATHEEQWGLYALPEVRLQVAAERFRIPDVMVLAPGATDTLIVRSAPLLCIEIFSSDDRMSRMEERAADYKKMGVPSVWVVDPWRRLAYNSDAAGTLIRETTALTIPGTPVSVTVDEIFAELDRLGQRG